MNLHHLLMQRAAAGAPLRVLLIGAGKFGSMFLSQVRRTPGLHLVAVADLSPQRAQESLARVGWPAEQYVAASLDDAQAAIANDAIEIVIDATGSPAADSLACAGLRSGLAHGVKITRRVAKGLAVTWNDIAAPDSEAVRVRREMEAAFRGKLAENQTGHY